MSATISQPLIFIVHKIYKTNKREKEIQLYINTVLSDHSMFRWDRSIVGLNETSESTNSKVQVSDFSETIYQDHKQSWFLYGNISI